MACSEKPIEKKLNPCPCGKTPDELSIIGDGGKWSHVSGSCCGEWEMEFRSNYFDSNNPECIAVATERWNNATAHLPTVDAEPVGEVIGINFAYCTFQVSCDSNEKLTKMGVGAKLYTAPPKLAERMEALQVRIAQLECAEHDDELVVETIKTLQHKITKLEYINEKFYKKLIEVDEWLWLLGDGAKHNQLDKELIISFCQQLHIKIIGKVESWI